MSYTSSLEYAKTMAKQRLKDGKTSPKIRKSQQQLMFVTLYDRATLAYDSVMSTACTRGLRYITLTKSSFEDHKWEPIIAKWLWSEFCITQMAEYDEGGFVSKVNTFVETESPSGARQGLDIGVVIHSVIGQVRRHLNDVTSVEHGKEDKLPLWWLNETTKKHDKATVAAYTGDDKRMVKLGGNFNTSLIKTPITFEKEVVTDVLPDGEVVSVVHQNVIWEGKDGDLRRYDYAMHGVLGAQDLDIDMESEEFAAMVVEEEKKMSMIVPAKKKPSTTPKTKCLVVGDMMVDF